MPCRSWASSAVTVKDAASFNEGMSVLINTTSCRVTTTSIDQAHATDTENARLNLFVQSNKPSVVAEFRKYLDRGMDGMFVNCSGLAVAARGACIQDTQAMQLCGGNAATRHYCHTRSLQRVVWFARSCRVRGYGALVPLVTACMPHPG